VALGEGATGSALQIVISEPGFKVIGEPYVGLVGKRDATDEVDVMIATAHQY
jgi:hypothetical protein